VLWWPGVNTIHIRKDYQQIGIDLGTEPGRELIIVIDMLKWVFYLDRN
jgi:hypothetical protein